MRNRRVFADKPLCRTQSDAAVLQFAISLTSLRQSGGEHFWSRPSTRVHRTVRPMNLRPT